MKENKEAAIRALGHPSESVELALELKEINRMYEDEIKKFENSTKAYQFTRTAVEKKISTLTNAISMHTSNIANISSTINQQEIAYQLHLQTLQNHF